MYFLVYIIIFLKDGAERVFKNLKFIKLTDYKIIIDLELLSFRERYPHPVFGPLPIFMFIPLFK